MALAKARRRHEREALNRAWERTEPAVLHVGDVVGDIRSVRKLCVRQSKQMATVWRRWKEEEARAEELQERITELEKNVKRSSRKRLLQWKPTFAKKKGEGEGTRGVEGEGGG